MNLKSFIQSTVKLAVMAVVAMPAVAFAGTCITFDPNTDGLSEQDRKSALSVLAGTLEQEGQGPVTPDQCTQTYSVNHAKLGNSVTVTLKGPQGQRQGTVPRVEDLPALYSQMVKSLISGQPMGVMGDNVTRDNVTPNQTAPMRAEADSLWYVNLGYGAILGNGFAGGPGFGWGWRYELDSFALDASMSMVYSTADSQTSASGFSGSLIRLMGLYYFSPMANRSLYAGGGLSYGGTVVTSGSYNETFSKAGLQGELAVGYEFFRATTVRLFGQFNATMPFYMTSGSSTTQFDPATDTYVDTPSSASRYTPTLLLSMGIAFGRNHAIAIRQM